MEKDSFRHTCADSQDGALCFLVGVLFIVTFPKWAQPPVQGTGGQPTTADPQFTDGIIRLTSDTGLYAGGILSGSQNVKTTSSR